MLINSFIIHNTNYMKKTKWYLAQNVKSQKETETKFIYTIIEVLSRIITHPTKISAESFKNAYPHVKSHMWFAIRKHLWKTTHWLRQTQNDENE